MDSPLLPGLPEGATAFGITIQKLDELFGAMSDLPIRQVAARVGGVAPEISRHFANGRGEANAARPR